MPPTAHSVPPGWGTWALGGGGCTAGQFVPKAEILFQELSADFECFFRLRVGSAHPAGGSRPCELIRPLFPTPPNCQLGGGTEPKQPVTVVRRSEGQTGQPQPMRGAPHPLGGCRRPSRPGPACAGAGPPRRRCPSPPRSPGGASPGRPVAGPQRRLAPGRRGQRLMDGGGRGFRPRCNVCPTPAPARP